MLPRNWIISAIVLVLALAGVFYLQRQLADSGPSPLEQTAPPAELLSGQIDWCGEQTVTKIQLPGQFLLTLEETEWTHNGNIVPGVAEWLKTNCVFTTETATPVKPSTLLNAFVTITYADGKTASFQADPEGSLAWNGVLFRSQQFNQALVELRRLAQK